VSNEIRPFRVDSKFIKNQIHYMTNEQKIEQLERKVAMANENIETIIALIAKHGFTDPRLQRARDVCILEQIESLEHGVKPRETCVDSINN
jgi:hypothetical protein